MSISYKYLVLLITLSFLSFGCSDFHTHAEGEHDHDHTETSGESSTVEQHQESEVELTSEQIATVGLTIGEMQELKIAGFIKANGVLDLPPDEIATVTAPASGFVQSTKGEYLIGSYVKKGTILARLEHPDYLQLQQDYLEIVAQLEFSRQEVTRQQELRDANAGVLKSLQEATSVLKRQEAQAKGLVAKLRYLGIDPQQVANGKVYSTISIAAPLSGYITKLNINQGRYVQPEEMLYEIVNDQHVHLELDVFESNITQVEEGMPISFTLPSLSKEVFAGEVRLVGRSFNMDNKTVRVHGHIEGKNPSFIRGAYVEAKIWNDAATVQALPEEAVISQEGLDFVFILEENSLEGMKFRRVAVKTGEKDDGYIAVELLESLPEGVLFVTTQAYYLAAQMMKGELQHEH